MTDPFIERVDALAAGDLARAEFLRDQLAEANLPLVRFVASKIIANLPYAGTAGREMDDLVAYGSLGLINAIERFDPSLGFRFSTYAVPRVNGAILDGLQKASWAPKSVNTNVRDLTRAQEQLGAVFGRAATEDELSARLEWSTEQLRAARLDKHRERNNALDAAGDSSGAVPAARIDDDSETTSVSEEIRGRMIAGLQELAESAPELAAVLAAYYSGAPEEQTFPLTAARMGVGREYVSNAYGRALERLRGHIALFGPTGSARRS